MLFHGLPWGVDQLILMLFLFKPSLHPNELKPYILANHNSAFNHVGKTLVRCHCPYIEESQSWGS